MKFARGKESYIHPVNLQLNERNSGTRAYCISLLQSAEHNHSSYLTKVAASPRPLLECRGIGGSVGASMPRHCRLWTGGGNCPETPVVIRPESMGAWAGGERSWST